MEVVPGGPADKAGMQAGDVILRVNEKRVNTAKDVGKEVRAHDAGSQITVTVWRKGREQKAEVVLGEVPQNL